jgi:NADH:ubiquinone oxidoreductase subunit 3 (subunit A)
MGRFTRNKGNLRTINRVPIMIQTYFVAERRAAYWALSLGILHCAVGAALLLGVRPPFYTGLALPLLLIGVAQMTVGVVVGRRSERQAEDLERLLAESPAEFRQSEGARMAKVLRSFSLYKWVEIAFVVVGLALILLNPVANFAKGLGAGMLYQGALMLVFDCFAEKRGRAYADFVQKQ